MDQELGSIQRLQNDVKSEFEILPTGYKVNIEFNNLTFEVPDREQGLKPILKSINGEFRSKQITAIMGTSGSGKSTLINILAGFRINKTSGTVYVNKKPQKKKSFHKMSRYILQEDHVSPHFTVMESMLFAAKLKLDIRLSEQQHKEEIYKILETLQLRNQENTKVLNLSGGEKKRLCIGLELLNLPTVLFLDEPTTGLDEFSAMQCISMLKCLASSGRTIICSLHAPSARLFQLIDHVYILNDGECVYQGSTTNILPYLGNIGLNCPITYNPADYIIEVAAREYGDYHEQMVTEIRNGKISNWLPTNESEQSDNEYLNPKEVEEFELEINSKFFTSPTTPWFFEYKILCNQMLKEMWRDKPILKSINGEFRSKQITAIMGTSGSGKSTLINILAGFRINKTSGTVYVNKKPQKKKSFHKMSRYILQEDHVSPHFTVMESMLFAAKLKLDIRLSEQQHKEEIYKILETLQLRNQENTKVLNLSGGEKKRLCIGLELLNLPTVLFLDEPTTGLDEFSAMQCISMLKCLASSGRTIICSLHAPSARLFQLIDHVYILNDGECVYQGSTTNILPYLGNIGLNCPITYNPADYIIEVAAREYGDYHEQMVTEIRNGKISNWLPTNESEQSDNEYLNPKEVEEFELEINSKFFTSPTTPWFFEYKILCNQMLKEMWRDKNYIKLKVFIKLFTVLCISLVYTGIGMNASMLIYNYHLAFLTSIVFVFLSMCPMLSHIPLGMQYLRREYFNQWYRLSTYFMALITTQIPDIFLLGTISCAVLYFTTDQPVELYRFVLYLLVALLTSMTSSSYGMALSSRLNLLNSLFLGPSIISCLVIFANHSVGNPNMSTVEKVFMYCSYIRHSVEGLMSALIEFNRPDAICPPEEVFCLLKKPKYLLKIVGFENLNYVHSILYLFGFYVLFNIIAYFNFKCRLSSSGFLENNRYYQNFKKRMWKYIYLKLY